MIVPYKHSTSSPPYGFWGQALHGGRHFLSTGRHRGVLQAGPPDSPWRLASSEHNVLLPHPPLCLLTFCYTGSGQPDASDFQPTATGWLVEAGLLCAEPDNCYQRPIGGLIDIKKMGGHLGPHDTYFHCWETL